MKHLLLAAALIILPVGAFTAFNLYATKTGAGITATAGLGDMSAFTTIITDVQGFAAKSDFEGAKTRIKDFEIAWDENSKGLRPMDPAMWDAIDGAADTGLKAVRASTPDAAAITTALAGLQTALGAK